MRFAVPAPCRPRALALALAALAVSAATAGPASASSITTSNGAVTYTGAASEANHVTFWFDTQYGVFVVQDTGVTRITVGEETARGCHAYTSQIAWCEPNRVTSITANLGGRGGFAQSKLAQTPVTFNSGAGNDTMIGGAGATTLVAGAGSDTLTAGSGNTRLVGGTGSTAMTGGSGQNTYEGGAGADTINARNGVAETIACAGGADSVVADADDSADADCEAVDRGVPSTPPPADALPATPGVDPSPPVFSPPVPVISTTPLTLAADGRLPVRLDCPAAADGGCSGSISLALVRRNATRGKVVAARHGHRRGESRVKRFRIAAGEKAVVPVQLSRRAARSVRRRVRRGRKVGIAVTVMMRTEAGTHKVTRTMTVRGARRSARRR